MKSFFDRISFPSFKELEPGEFPFWKLYQLSLYSSSLKKEPIKLPFFVAFPQISGVFQPFYLLPSFFSLFSGKKDPYFLKEGEKEKKKQSLHTKDFPSFFEGVLIEDKEGALLLELKPLYAKILSSYFSLSKDSFSILVMTKEERNSLALPISSEIGKSFSFSLEDLFEVNLSFNKKKLQFIKVKAPSLEVLRERYLLPSKVKGRAFFIPIKETPLKKSSSFFCKINPASLSA